jgi:predicted DsbA family dithiol-disulfide isomerase
LFQPELQKTVDAAGISAVPTFLFHRGGKVVSKFSGADSKKLQSTVEDLRAEGEL